jgi:hypothetical protein
MSERHGGKTIGEEIDRLARQTGAPQGFVGQMRDYFLTRLTDDAAPYLPAIEEAFLLEETVRRNTTRARENLVRLQECVRLVGTTYQQQLGQLRRVRDTLEHQGKLVREGATRLRDLTRAVTKAHPRKVALVHDEALLVPGPSELQ